MKIELLHPRAAHALGFIPSFLDESLPGTAAEQFDKNYIGNWSPFGVGKWTLGAAGELKYPGDPPMRPLARIWFHKEQIFIYDHAWVCIKQNDGSFEVCRMD